MGGLELIPTTPPSGASLGWKSLSGMGLILTDDLRHGGRVTSGTRLIPITVPWPAMSGARLILTASLRHVEPAMGGEGLVPAASSMGGLAIPSLEFIRAGMELRVTGMGFGFRGLLLHAAVATAVAAATGGRGGGLVAGLLLCLGWPTAGLWSVHLCDVTANAGIVMV